MGLATMRQNPEKCMEHPQIFVLSAYLIIKEGESRLAIQEVDTGLKYARLDTRAMLLLIKAMAYLRIQDFNNALEVCRGGLSEFPEYKPLGIIYGFSLWSRYKFGDGKMKDLDKAIEVTKKAAQSSDKDSLAISESYLCYYYAEKGNIAVAKEHFKKLKHLEPEKDKWPAVYKNTRGFILLKQIKAKRNRSIKAKLKMAYKAYDLFNDALSESTHPEIKNNYRSAEELIIALKKKKFKTEKEKRRKV